MNQSLSVQQAMQAPPLVLDEGVTMVEACRVMEATRSKEVVASRGTASSPASPVLAGIVTESDALRLIATDQKPAAVTLADLMSHPLRTITPEHSLDHAITVMRAHRVHRLPVIRRGELVGLLTMERALLAQFRHLVGLRRENARLEAEAHQDPLTGLANRRLFDKALDREIAQSQRFGRTLGLLMIDIDFFKSINDEHGHPKGDQVLQELASRLEARVRRSDLLARVGGEEFAVLVTVPGPEQLLTLAEELRATVAAEPFSLTGDIGPDERTAEVSVTISIGAAMFGGWSNSGRRLIKEADTALYEAKSAGRNCVRFVDLDPEVSSLRTGYHQNPTLVDQRFSQRPTIQPERRRSAHSAKRNSEPPLR